MTDDQSLSQQPADHAAPIGDLAGVFERRSIAVGSDSNGNVILVRPDSLLVSIDGDEDRLGRAVEIVGGWDKEQAGALLRRDVAAEGGLLTVSIPRADASICGERRASLEPLRARRAEFVEAGLPADFNHVLFGAQAFLGHPLGAAAQWVGEMAFPTAGTHSVSSGQLALLTTAKPADAPADLRKQLKLAKDPPRVLVLDTGLRTADGAGKQPEHPELQSCFVHQPWEQDSAIGAHDDEDEADDDGLGLLDYEAGHGTFIAGIIRQFCPDAEIHTAGVLSSFGDGDVSSVLRNLRRVLALMDPPDIIVMSFGGFFADDDPGVFERELLSIVGPEPLLVAAAGNEFTCRKCYPAALNDVVAVGGLACDGRAWFSNFGGWVDACAPAIDVLSTFFLDAEERIDGEVTRSWNGWARWSGTSFAAPKVAAAIAQEMYLFGGTAREAWKRMSSHQHLRVPDLGVVVNV